MITTDAAKYLKELVQAGDQNGFSWDPLLKLWLLQQHGFTNVVHQIHTSDLFSQRRMTVDHPTVTPEAYNFQGDLLRWTASCECATFLGRMPVHPSSYDKLGIDLRRLAAYLDKEINEVVLQLTAGDWLGMVLPSENMIAHGIHMSIVQSVFTELSRPMRNDLIRAFWGKTKADGPEDVMPKNVELALEHFDAMFNMGAYGDASWGDAMQAHWKKNLGRFGVNGECKITTSVDAFAFHVPQVRKTNPFFCLFWDNYEIAREAYNQAIGGEGEAVKALKDKELPFYVVIRCFDSGQLKRKDLEYCPPKENDKKGKKDPIVMMLERINREEGVVIALLGKAIPHIGELRMRAPMVIPRKGSSYLGKAFKFERLLQKALGKKIDFHPLIRIDPNALDALKEVNGEFYLPAYLEPWFDVEPGQPIACADFGRRWRHAVAAAHVEKEMLHGLSFSMKPKNETRLHEQLQFMVRRGIFEEDLRQELMRLRERINDYNRRRKEAFSQHQQATPELETEAKTINALKKAMQMLENGIAYLLAEYCRDLINVTDLEYWNARPFAHWILAVPGWKEAILQYSRVYIDPDSTHKDLNL